MSEPTTEQELDHAEPVLLSDADRRRGMLFVCIVVGFVGFAFAVQIGLNDNFWVEEFGVEGFEKGLTEAIRESCGIVAFLVLAAMAGLAEPMVAMWMLLLAGVGLGSYVALPNFGSVLAVSWIWSLGAHVWFPLPNAMTLSLAEPHRRGLWMGLRRAAEAVGMMIGFLVGIALTAWLHVPIRHMFLIAGIAFVIGASACFAIPKRLRTPGPRLVFRWKYALYYLISFLEGWRKQVFLAFAGYLLVTRHGAQAWQILTLLAITHGMGFVTGPLVGMLIDRIGERKVLMIYFAALTACFLGYAHAGDPNILFGIFILGNALVVMDMARTTYVGRLAPASERTATLSMGVAFNHVAAVIMPLLGGVLWMNLGYQWPFYLGAITAAVSVVVAHFVPERGGGKPVNSPA